MLMTRPMTSSPASPCAMCSGVITMTLTIVTWPRARVTQPEPGRRDAGRRPAAPGSPSRGPGRTPHRRRGAAAGPRGAGRGAAARTSRPSGEEQADDGEDVGAGERPAGRGARATGRPAPTRLGPRTLPTVVAQTTMPRSRARCFGSARSAAAYRAWPLDAVAPPKSRLATRSRAKLPTTAAAMIPTAPTAASR